MINVEKKEWLTAKKILAALKTLGGSIEDGFKISKKDYPTLNHSFHIIKNKMYTTTNEKLGEKILGKGNFGKVKYLQSEEGKALALKIFSQYEERRRGGEYIKDISALYDENELKILDKLGQLKSDYTLKKKKKFNRIGQVKEFEKKYIAMEYFQGHSLYQETTADPTPKHLKIDDHINKSKLKKDERLIAFIKAIESITEIHENYRLVHGDIKPDNFMFNKNENDNINITVVDFGKARQLEKGVMEKELDITIGSNFFYPEDEHKTSYKLDIRALGKTGKTLLTHEDNNSLNKEVINYVSDHMENNDDGQVNQYAFILKSKLLTEGTKKEGKEKIEIGFFSNISKIPSYKFINFDKNKESIMKKFTNIAYKIEKNYLSEIKINELKKIEHEFRQSQQNEASYKNTMSNFIANIYNEDLPLDPSIKNNFIKIYASSEEDKPIILVNIKALYVETLITQALRNGHINKETADLMMLANEKYYEENKFSHAQKIKNNIFSLKQEDDKDINMEIDKKKITTNATNNESLINPKTENKDIKEKIKEKTKLMQASDVGDVNLVKELLEQGVAINELNNNMQNALVFALSDNKKKDDNQKINILKLLFNHDNNIEIKGKPISPIGLGSAENILEVANLIKKQSIEIQDLFAQYQPKIFNKFAHPEIRMVQKIKLNKIEENFINLINPHSKIHDFENRKGIEDIKETSDIEKFLETYKLHDRANAVWEYLNLDNKNYIGEKTISQGFLESIKVLVFLKKNKQKSDIYNNARSIFESINNKMTLSETMDAYHSTSNTDVKLYLINELEKRLSFKEVVDLYKSSSNKKIKLFLMRKLIMKNPGKFILERLKKSTTKQIKNENMNETKNTDIKIEQTNKIEKKNSLRNRLRSVFSIKNIQPENQKKIEAPKELKDLVLESKQNLQKIIDALEGNHYKSYKKYLSNTLKLNFISSLSELSGLNRKINKSNMMQNTIKKNDLPRYDNKHEIIDLMKYNFKDFEDVMNAKIEAIDRAIGELTKLNPKHEKLLNVEPKNEYFAKFHSKINEINGFLSQKENFYKQQTSGLLYLNNENKQLIDKLDNELNFSLKSFAQSCLNEFKKKKFNENTLKQLQILKNGKNALDKDIQNPEELENILNNTFNEINTKTKTVSKFSSQISKTLNNIITKISKKKFLIQNKGLTKRDIRFVPSFKKRINESNKLIKSKRIQNSSIKESKVVSTQIDSTKKTIIKKKPK